MWFQQNLDVLHGLGPNNELTVFVVDVTMVEDPVMITTASMPVARKLQWGPRCKFLLCTTGTTVVSDVVHWCNSLAELRYW